MKGIFPLEQFPLRERSRMYGLLIVFMVAWIVMLFASLTRTPGVNTGIGFMLEASFVLAFAIGAIQMKALARARDVFAGQPLPLSLWRKWVLACVTETSLAWAFLAVGMSILLGSHGSHLQWPGAVALLSSSLATGALCVLARYAMAPKELGWLANSAVIAMLLAGLYFGAVHVLTWIVSLPLPILALLALSWPVLGAVLVRLRGQTAALSRLPPAARNKWFAAMLKWMWRYTPLDATWARQPQAEQATARSRLEWFRRNAFYWVLFGASLTRLRWEQSPDLRHLLSLALLCLLMSESLIARDLHWRWLLAPGAWRSGRIASNIFASTVKFWYLCIVGGVLAGTLSMFVAMGPIVLAGVEELASDVLVLAEISFAVSVGLVIRALPHRTVVTWATGAVVAGSWIYTRVVGAAALPKAPPAGVFYAVALVASAYAILRVADRLWTKEKLMACARGAI